MNEIGYNLTSVENFVGRVGSVGSVGGHNLIYSYQKKCIFQDTFLLKKATPRLTHNLSIMSRFCLKKDVDKA